MSQTLSDPLVLNRDTSLSLPQPIREIHKTSDVASATTRWCIGQLIGRQQRQSEKKKQSPRPRQREEARQKKVSKGARATERTELFVDMGRRGYSTKRQKVSKEYYRMGWRLQALLVPRGPMLCFLGFANRNALTSSIGIAYRTRLSLHKVS